jgi:excisionase family DNA binding protein
MPSRNDPLRPLTKAQVCDLLGVHLATLNRLIHAGEIRVVYVGVGRRSPRITREALHDYLERAAVVPDGAEPEVDDEEERA